MPPAEGETRVQVSIRLRPRVAALDEEEGGGDGERIVVEGSRCAFRQHAFQFANVFGAAATNEQVYAAHRVAVADVLRGFDCTLLAYGATGSGKTHTMMGAADGSEPGAVPLAADTLFDEILARHDDSTSFSISLAVLEILEERCFDLLHDRATVVLRSGAPAGSKGGALHFHGLEEVQVRSKEQLVAEIERGKRARTQGETYRHGCSSRAHTVVRLRVEAARLVEVQGEGDSRESLSDLSSGVLTLVDLAGSEAATLNRERQRVSEGIAINKSLHWLKAVVHALAAHKPVLHFRNSAITRLLQPSLAGQAVVAVLVTVPLQPGDAAGRDALDALMFGEEAGKLRLAPSKNNHVAPSGQVGKLQALLVQMADDKAALASDAESLREQVQSYQALVDDLRGGLVTAASLQAAGERRAAELATALRRSAVLESQLGEAQAAREAVEAALHAVESEAGAVAARNAQLEGAVADAIDGRRALEARLGDVREALAEARAQAADREAALAGEREAQAALRAQVEALEARSAKVEAAAEATQWHADEVRETGTAAARTLRVLTSDSPPLPQLARRNAAAQRALETVREESEGLKREKESLASVARAKGELLILKSKLYRSRSLVTRPWSAGPAGGGGCTVGPDPRVEHGVGTPE